MSHDNGDRIEVNRRRFLGATGAGLIVSGLGNTAAAMPSGDGGDGDDGDGIGDDSFIGDEHTVTLISGHTVHVTHEGDERVYAIEGDGPYAYEVIEREEGTYLFPDEVDRSFYDPRLFNVDLLIEQGYTDEDVDATPVILRQKVDTLDSQGMHSFGDGARELASIDAVATEVPKEGTAMTAQTLSLNTSVERVLLDIKYRAELDDSAPAISAGEARDEFDVDGDDVRIAVVDTGIDDTHSDLEERVEHIADHTGEGYQDDNGHGTHVAGIAAGDGTESDGDYVGVAPGATVLNAKALDEGGSGQLSDIVAAIEDAVTEDADVINLSLGGPVMADDPLEDAVDFAHGEGVIVAVSAGNVGFGTNYEQVTSPGQAKGAITVGATDRTGDEPELADFTAYGPTVHTSRVKPDVVAPGVELTATGSADADEDPYTDKSGTSMSAPMVAGLGALLLEDDGDRDPESIRRRLMTTAHSLSGDVYQEGAGEVDALDALGTDIVIHDPVTNFGTIGDPGEEEATIGVENVGDETVDLDTEATLYAVQDDEYHDDNVSLSPSSLSLEPGETTDVTLEIDTDVPFSFYSGVVTFESDEATYRAIFGFIRGLTLTVEKIPHENSDGGDVAGDSLFVWDHEGEFVENPLAGIPADGSYSFFIFSDEATVSVWSDGQLEPEGDQSSGDPTVIVEDGIDVDPENTTITIDENDVAPRDLDTSALEYDDFVMQEFDITFYAVDEDVQESVWPGHYTRGFIGDHGVDTAHFTEIGLEDPSNVSNMWLMSPEELIGEGTLDSQEVFHLYYPTEQVPKGGESVYVDPDELAVEHLSYHRRDDDQLYQISPHYIPADQDRFPRLISFGNVTHLSDELDEQTFYRTEHCQYSEGWYVNGGIIDAEWQHSRMIGFIPDAGTEYYHDFDREPLLTHVTAWNLHDDGLDAYLHWYAGQGGHRFLAYDNDFDNINEFEVLVDGTVVISDDYPVASYILEAEIDEIEDGSTVELHVDANTLTETPRAMTSELTHAVTYGDGTTDAPPTIDAVDIPGVTRPNEIASSAVIALIEVADDAGGVASFDAYYANADDVDDPPKDDDGWNDGEVVYADDGKFAVAMDLTGRDESDLAIAFEVTDDDGNETTVTTFGGPAVFGWADEYVPVDVKANTINLRSNRTIPVEIEPTDDVDPHDIEDDTLRFGAPEAVYDGGGASAERVRRLPHGSLQAHFRASELGYDENASPGTTAIYAELEDETVISGADVVDEIKGA